MMDDQFKPYVHLNTSGNVYNGNANMTLRYRIAVDPQYQYYKRNFNGATPQYSMVSGGIRHFEVLGYLPANVPSSVTEADRIHPDANNQIIAREDFQMSDLGTEHKVILSVIASDTGGGTGQSTSYYIEAEDDE